MPGGDPASSVRAEPSDDPKTTLLISVRRNIWLYPVLANIAVASTFFVGVVAWHPVHFSGLPLAPLLIGTSIAASILFPVASFTARLSARRRLRLSTAWIEEGRSPTAGELDHLAQIPRHIALHGAGYWVSALLWGTPLIYSLGYHFDLLIWSKVVVAWSLIGLSGATLSYLVSERSLRPLRALALSYDVDTSRVPRTMGMLPRLALAWLAAAGMPLTTIAVFLAGTDPAERARSAPMIWYTSSVGLGVGIAITIFAARAIADPIKQVYGALRAVGEGKLDTGLAVDETGELGLLQSGFNQMVAGLRDRERLREIFGHHVGLDVAQRAMDGDVALGGELVEATAMFVDVIASSALAEEREPDQVVHVLNAFFDAVVRCVGAEGGYVSKFEGDGALCVFGAPMPQADHAERALRAARALRLELRAMSENVDAAIGISSGHVVAGNIGAANRYEYTLIGDAVNEASRLTDEAKNRHTRVLASERTLAFCREEAANWGHSGTIHLRGRARPTVAFEPGLI